MKFIEISNLNYYYADCKQQALKEVNLDIQKGELILIAGRSGSGKSTLGKCITGAIPDFYGGRIGGKILVNGTEVSKLERNIRATTLAMVFQDPEKQLIMNKVHREVAFGLENIGENEAQVKRRVFESLQFLNILPLAYRDIDSLSGGEKQKVAIASALSFLPQCIILDEPTSQLDPASADEIVSLIKKINEELGITVILIEQRVDRWIQGADRIFVLEKGSLMFQGTGGEMYSSENHEVTEFLPSYLRLMKKLDISEYPENLKMARNLIQNKKFKMKSEKKSGKKENIISLKNVSCCYENNFALKNVNFQVSCGDFIGLIGANGAGKSTLLKTITGLLKYSGSVSFQGAEIKKLKLKDIAAKVAYLSQNPNDYLTKDSVYEELKFTLDNYGIQNNDVIEETLKKLGLWDLRHRNPKDLSGGERQRTAIASILVLKPQLLLLDEPTRGLDHNTKINLGKYLKSLNESGMTILMVTHDMDFAAEFCSKFLIMFSGEVTAQGSAEEILKNGLYYTTMVNKLLRGKAEYIFTEEQAEGLVDYE